MRRLALPALSAMLLAACASAPQAPMGQHGAAPAAAESMMQIHGRAFHLERMRLAPGATLDVQLIDDAIADALPVSATPAATIARRQFDVHSGSPYAFVLPVARARTVAGARYSVRASLRDASGHLMFATAARVPVTPAAQADVHLVRALID